MIVNDAELEVVQSQLRKAEHILELTKREVGHNPVQYHLFSSGIIDLIDSLRADIDAYLGVTTAREPVTHPPDQQVTSGTARP